MSVEFDMYSIYNKVLKCLPSSIQYLQLSVNYLQSVDNLSNVKIIRKYCVRENMELCRKLYEETNIHLIEIH